MRTRATALALGLLMAALPLPRPALAEPAPARPDVAATAPVITLITGDQVHLAEEAPSIQPAKGREHIPFSTYTRNGHQYVVPRDAISLVSRGLLDERLFDVTGLLADGYGDAARADIPVIVTYGASARAQAVTGLTVTRQLPSLNATAATAPKTGALWSSFTSARTASAGLTKIWLDGVRTTSLDYSVPQIGAPAAWKAGFDGTGVKVAVLDTGVDQTHPDLSGRQVAEQNFTTDASAADGHGHGTHVASTIAGNGAKYRGVAPGAQIMDGKVLNSAGNGQESWIIAGMEWAAAGGAKVVNLSLGGTDTPGLDPLEQTVNNLSEQYGTLFVIAAGNSGPNSGTVASPGSADAALTVGAVDRNDALASFSSRGPRIGDKAVKPDITAPGVGIVAARATGTSMGTPVDSLYTAASGTSMATPHVVGAVALLAQQHPDWKGQQLKATLTAAAKPTAGLTPFEQGSGRVDVAKAITQTLTASPTSVSFGQQQWPHTDDVPVVKTVTLANSGSAAATLDLSIESDAPTGTFAVSPANVTVPAGGTATVQVTADTRAGTTDGVFSGTLVAGAGQQALRVPFGVDKEVESYNLTVNHIGLDGKPALDAVTTLVSMKDVSTTYAYDEADGSATVRLPKGEYTLDGSVGVGEKTYWLTSPGFKLTSDTKIDLDFRTAKSINITTPDPTAVLSLGQVGYARTGTAYISRTWLYPLGADLARLHTAHVGPKVDKDLLTIVLSTQSKTPSGDYYNLTYYERGKMPSGYVKHPSKRDLAKVRTAYSGKVPTDMEWRKGVAPSPVKGSVSAWTTLMLLDWPGARTEYLTTEGVRWDSTVYQFCCLFYLYTRFRAPTRDYQAGRTYDEPYNTGPFNPALGPTGSSAGWVTRANDTIYANTPLFADASGNLDYVGVNTIAYELYRNGAKIGEQAQTYSVSFPVPPGKADYRLRAESTRGTYYDTATKVTAEWTFKSDTVAGDDRVRLPVSTIKFTPDLAAAKPGRRLDVPVAVVPQNSDRPQHVRRLTAEVSYDSGATWSAARVKGDRVISLTHPANATSVSLRAKATDERGNTVEQTIIDAYLLK
ncbi:S8 family serine peptidase [Nonomuraea sp. CA-143628]|uniref:S8 family serine peptidase n=1 Tax=Nonomuraea sp. CA-143628 TaxID=3239997 RepID=UPI003D94C40B